MATYKTTNEVFTLVAPKPTWYFADPIKHWFQSISITNYRYIIDTKLMSSHATLQRIEEYYPTVSTIFVAVNPWQLNFENFLNVRKAKADDPSNVNLEKCNTTSLEAFINPNIKNYRDLQTTWIGNRIPTYTFKFETLAKDFRVIQDYFETDAPIDVPLLEDYRPHYTDRARKIIAEAFAKDIEYFGYTFE